MLQHDAKLDVAIHWRPDPLVHEIVPRHRKPQTYGRPDFRGYSPRVGQTPFKQACQEDLCILHMLLRLELDMDCCAEKLVLELTRLRQFQARLKLHALQE